MGRSFKKVPSIKKPKETGYNKKGTSIILSRIYYEKITEKFKKHCIKEYGKKI